MPVNAVPYDRISLAARSSDGDVGAFLRAELPLVWCDRYLQMGERPSEIVTFTIDTFDYFYDSYQDEEAIVASVGCAPVEARLVAAIGAASPRDAARDDSRLRGLVLSAMFGADADWDRGHFIGHSIGGGVDGNEANVFK